MLVCGKHAGPVLMGRTCTTPGICDGRNMRRAAGMRAFRSFLACVAAGVRIKTGDPSPHRGDRLAVFSCSRAALPLAGASTRQRVIERGRTAGQAG